MNCNLCKDTDSVCAFGDLGRFDSDTNYCCKTLDKLREYFDNYAVFSEDSWCYRFPLISSEDFDFRSGFIIMVHYKNRGRTSILQYMNDDGENYPATLEQVELLLSQLPLIK